MYLAVDCVGYEVSMFFYSCNFYKLGIVKWLNIDPESIYNSADLLTVN